MAITVLTDPFAPDPNDPLGSAGKRWLTVAPGNLIRELGGKHGRHRQGVQSDHRGAPDVARPDAHAGLDALRDALVAARATQPAAGAGAGVDAYDAPDAALYPAAILGWRAWALDERTIELRAVNGNFGSWAPGAPLAATCRKPEDYSDAKKQRKRAKRLKALLPADLDPGIVDDYVCRKHESPTPGCECGVWAVRHPRFIPNPSRQIVVGLVSLWGRVVPGSRGFRAAQAYPERLFVFNASENIPPDQVDYFTSFLYGRREIDGVVASDPVGIAKRLSDVYGVPAWTVGRQAFATVCKEGLA